MAQLQSASLSIKLSTVMICLALSLHLFSMQGSQGYASSTYSLVLNDCRQKETNKGTDQADIADKCKLLGSFRAVQAFEIIAFLCSLTATYLVLCLVQHYSALLIATPGTTLCLVHIDQINGNKIIKNFVIVTSLVGGLFAIIGVAIFEASLSKAPITSTLAVVSGLSAIVAGIVTIVDISGSAACKCTQ